MTRLSESFFLRSTLRASRALLGMHLCTRIDGSVCKGRIVEVEAYGPHGDAACHAATRRTARNEVMFARAGLCYVYLIYGMHYCVNVVTEKESSGAAVLIRALEPVSGIAAMRSRRPVAHNRELCSGPAKLCQSLGITQDLLGEDMCRSKRIWLEEASPVPAKYVVRAPRIGISKATELEWRMYDMRSDCVSVR